MSHSSRLSSRLSHHVSHHVPLITSLIKSHHLSLSSCNVLVDRFLANAAGLFALFTKHHNFKIVMYLHFLLVDALSLILYLSPLF